MEPISEKGSIPAVEPKKRTGIVSYHEGELHSRPDSSWAISFGYFRGKHPRDVLPHADPDGPPEDES